MQVLNIQNGINNSHNVQFKAITNGSGFITQKTVKKLEEIAGDYDVSIYDRNDCIEDLYAKDVIYKIESAKAKSKYSLINRWLEKHGVVHPPKVFSINITEYHSNGYFETPHTERKPEEINKILLEKFQEAMEKFKDTIRLNNLKEYRISQSWFLRMLKIK